MNGQPNQGLASLTGGMGGSPTLGGAPQTPPTPQGAQQPQPTPQGGLPPDLLKALAMARVKKMQEAAKRDLELQMAQQQAASGEDKKTVVQQMEEGVEKEAMDETQQALTKKLSGGIQEAAQQSAQPMSGGIASAPGANQAAQPEAMASGGIVAFAGPEGSFIEGQDIPEAKELEEAKAALKSLSPVGTSAMARDPEGAKEKLAQYREASERVKALQSAYEKALNLGPAGANFRQNPAPQMIAANRPAEGGIPAALSQPKGGLMAADYEDMRGPQGGIPTTPQRPPAQRPPAPAAQAQRPAAIQQPSLNIQTNPSYAPPAQGLGGLLESSLTTSIKNDPAEARKAALEEYQRMVPQDQGLVDQRKKDAAALRAALEKQNAPLDWSDRLSAMAQGAMGGVRGGSNWMSEGVAGGAKLRGLEAAHAAKQAENLGVLKGMSEDDYNRDIALKEKLYGVGSKAYQEAVKAREEYLKTGAHLFSTQEQARTASEQRKSVERIHELDRDAAERRVRLEAQLRASIPAAEIQLIERYMKDAGVTFAEAYKEIAGIKRPDKFEDKAYDKLREQQIMTKDPVEKEKIQKKMDAQILLF